MGFPVTASGTVRLSLDPRLTVEEVARSLEQALRAHDVEHVVRVGARISFEVPGVMGSGRAFTDHRLRLVRSGRRSPLTAISSGELELVWRDGGHVVRYEIGFLGLLLLATFAALFLAAVVCTSPGGGRTALVVVPIAWLWLFGGNYLLAFVAFARFLRRVQVQEAIWLPSSLVVRKGRFPVGSAPSLVASLPAAVETGVCRQIRPRPPRHTGRGVSRRRPWASLRR